MSQVKTYTWSEFPNLEWEDYLSAMDHKYNGTCDGDSDIDWDGNLADEYDRHCQREEEKIMMEDAKEAQLQKEEDERFSLWKSKLEATPVETLNRASKIISTALRGWKDHIESKAFDAWEEEQEKWYGYA